MQLEGAIAVIVGMLQSGSAPTHAEHEYDVYIPRVVRSHLGSSVEEFQVSRESGPFLDAAWELCRRGILRPGIRRAVAYPSQLSRAGLGFSLTSYGRQWLEGEVHSTLIPADPASFSQILARHTDRLGAGYHERSQDAVRCYFAQAYRACCAMSGAAAESILLRLAIAKTGDEDEVLRRYRTKTGRSYVENLVTGQAKSYLKSTLLGLNVLLKYWRDYAAHGVASNIDDTEASVALMNLVRYAVFADEHWEELTAGDA